MDSYDYDENGNITSIREIYLNGLEGSTEYATYYRYNYKEVKVYDLVEVIEVEEDSYAEINLTEQEIDATQGNVILEGRLEYRVGTNAAETMSKEMYILHIEPEISELTYYNLDDEISTAENITEIDIAGLDDEKEKGYYDGKNVSIQGKIVPTSNSHWFNSFAISLENIEFLD